MNYRLAYAIGFHPWEDAANDPVFVGKFHELIDREEKDRSRPFGPALDIGTGSGIWGIELAKRGWQVIGVDNIQAEKRGHSTFLKRYTPLTTISRRVAGRQDLASPLPPPPNSPLMAPHTAIAPARSTIGQLHRST